MTVQRRLLVYWSDGGDRWRVMGDTSGAPRDVQPSANFPLTWQPREPVTWNWTTPDLYPWELEVGQGHQEPPPPIPLGGNLLRRKKKRRRNRKRLFTPRVSWLRGDGKTWTDR